MQLYALYLGFMAVNGVTEAFLHSRSNKGILQKVQKLMFVNSV